MTNFDLVEAKARCIQVSAKCGFSEEELTMLIKQVYQVSPRNSMLLGVSLREIFTNCLKPAFIDRVIRLGIALELMNGQSNIKGYLSQVSKFKSGDFCDETAGIHKETLKIMLGVLAV